MLLKMDPFLSEEPLSYRDFPCVARSSAKWFFTMRMRSGIPTWKTARALDAGQAVSCLWLATEYFYTPISYEKV